MCDRTTAGSWPLLGFRLLSTNERHFTTTRIFSKGSIVKQMISIQYQILPISFLFSPRPFQSVILLSRLPFVNLFSEVLALIAPKYFAGGESVLHNACLDISNWPALQAGECIQLPLLGSIFQTYIPSLTSANLQQPYTSTPSAAINQIEDLKNLSPDSLTQSASEIKVPAVGSMSDECDNQCVKNDNICLSNEMERTSSSGDIIQSREDILDSYKQSKEMLLAQKLKSQINSPCDNKNSSKLTGANANDYENNDDADDADADLDDYFDGNFSDKLDDTANTQSDASTNNIERPLRLPHQQSMAKTPIVLSSVTEIDIFRSLYTVISYTHLLWELVLTAEPIVIMATSPSDCSHMVQSLMR